MSDICPDCKHPWSEHQPRVDDWPDELQVGCVHGWGKIDGCDCAKPRP